LHHQRFINYEEGTDFIETAQDTEEDAKCDLKVIDEKTLLYHIVFKKLGD
jgi:hypothetical protein